MEIVKRKAHSVGMKSKCIQKLVAESHAAQLKGEDFQAVAVRIAKRERIAWESEAYTELQSSPDPACICSECVKHFNT